MLKQLFSSQVRIDLLALFLMHPEEEFYVRELAEKLHSSPRSVNVELRNLEQIAILQRRISGKQHYYQVNTRNPLYADLRNLFLKTAGLRDLVYEQIAAFADEIDFAFIYGSFANGTFSSASDLDLLIIGRVHPRTINPALAKLREKIGREVNTSVFPLAEFESRILKKDHFISALIATPLLFIVGGEDEFRGLVKKWLAEKS